MTRINLGIDPIELCDQHLVAEYRELPRAFGFKNRTLAGPFRLNAGHVIWCSQFPGTLADRYRDIVREMRYRGFEVRYPEPRGDGARASQARLAGAREIVSERILEKLGEMENEPRWTRREPPIWVRSTLDQRSRVRSSKVSKKVRVSA